MTPTASRQAPADGVAVVERAVLLQQLVAGADTPLSLRELARRAELAPTTTKRLIRTLEGLSLVARDARGRYVVGASANTLTATRGPGVLGPIVDIVMKRVVDQFSESATVTVDEGSEALYAGCRVSAQDVQVPDVTGETSPFHLIASGLVLMASWNDERLQRYVEGPLEAATEASLTDPRALLQRVEQARRDSYAWSVGESLADITAVAVPVRDRHGSVIASVGIYGPSFRLDSNDPELPQRLAELVQSTTHALGL